jgi:hypothetical protein
MFQELAAKEKQEKQEKIKKSGPKLIKIGIPTSFKNFDSILWFNLFKRLRVNK